MKVKVKLYGNFLKYGPEESYITLPEKSTVKTVVEKLGIKELNYMMILVNTKRSWFTDRVKDGDTVHIFSPVGGG
ncbi:MAG: MoaD/ThiS family protein [Caldisericota bacterium]|nr:MoaD/ThiS family protein [Caldisericota bacterium]